MASCGTVSGYADGCRCDACRAAKSRYDAGRRRGAPTRCEVCNERLVEPSVDGMCGFCQEELDQPEAATA